MKLAEIAIRENRLTWFCIVAITVAGTLSFRQLPVSEDPPFVFRFALVYTFLPGASPERIDRLVTGPLEEAILEIPELEYTESFSREGVSLVSVKIQDRYDNMDPVWDLLNQKVNRTEANLPPGTIGPIVDTDFGEIYGILVGLTSETLEPYALQQLAEEIRHDLLLQPQVGQVSLTGIRQPRISVELNLEEMGMSGVSPFDVGPAIVKRNQVIPGGKVPLEAGGSIRLNPSNPLDDIEALRQTPVPLIDEAVTLPLDDLAEVTLALEDPPSEEVAIRGRPGIILGISMEEKGNIKELGRIIDARLEHWEERMRGEIQLEPVVFEPDRIDDKLGAMLVNLLQSLLIVFCILMIFLGFREGMVVSLLLPLAFLFSFCWMQVFGMTLNHVTVGGFIVVLGMLVDNNIVVAERIVRHRKEGMGGILAATAATSELHRPLIVSALTTIFAFLPIFLADSAAGEYTAPLFLVVAIALVSAEILVFTVTPLLSTLFFSSPASLVHTPGNTHRHPRYRKLLLKAVEHRWVSLTLTGALALGAVIGFQIIPKNFFPPSERPILTAEVQLGDGALFSETREVVQEMDRFIENELVPTTDIKSWSSFIGRNAPRYILNHRAVLASPEYGFFLFDLESQDSIPEITRRFEAYANEKFPGIDARVRMLEVGPAIGHPIQVRLTSPDLDGLVAVSEEVKSYLREREELLHISSNWGEPVIHYRLDPDLERAAEYGFTQTDLAGALQVKLNGLEVGRFLSEEGSLPIVLEVAEEKISDPETILDWQVVAPNTREVIQLGDIADLVEEKTLTTIARTSGNRSLTVNADLQPGLNPMDVDATILPWLEENRMRWLQEYNVTYEQRGEGRQAGIANVSLLKQIPIAALAVLILLIMQTRSLRSTFIVLVSVPLGVVGAIAGLFILGLPFGFMTLVGMVTLSGIVVNSAILLLDRIRLNMELDSMEPREAILDAAEQRFRAITLTSITTIGGMLPLFLFGGTFWRPMVTALIFGLAFATVLILIVIPVCYSFLFRIDFYSRKEGAALNPKPHDS